jgi:hypothetical protein
VRKNKVKQLEEQYSIKENNLLMEEVLYNVDLDLLGDNEAIANTNDQNTTQTRAEEVVVPMFSKLDDKLGFNAKTISKGQINSIVATYFAARKSIQDTKMRGFPACVLKIDYTYKLVAKVRVWKGPGASFCPYRCICTI